MINMTDLDVAATGELESLRCSWKIINSDMFGPTLLRSRGTKSYKGANIYSIFQLQEMRPAGFADE